MLLMSAGDEQELEKWRTQYGRCQLSPHKMRPKPTMDEALASVPSIIALMVRTKLAAGGFAGPLRLTREEVADICAATKLAPREVMALLLEVAAALGNFPGEGNHIGAVLEGESGTFYIGSPFEWHAKTIKFSSHGVQAALLNAWHHGETGLRTLMVQTPPCACCRQLLRESWGWDSLKILCAEEGGKSLQTGNILETEFSRRGLKNARGKLLADPQHPLKMNHSEANDLINKAAEAASYAYAPYSGNYAGIALRTKRGAVHVGRYVESSASIIGMLAIETALLNVMMSGETVEEVKEILLVETRGTVTQFSATQNLATAMGNIPFRFMTTN